MTDEREDLIEGLLGDDPIAAQDEDQLGRGPFADRVAALLDHVAEDTPSAVLALLGPWGSGKTSILHLVRQRLDRASRWRVVEFNPWMVSDLPGLVQEFFATLIEALPEGRKGKRLRKKAAHYAQAVAPLGAPFKFFGVDSQAALNTVGELLEGGGSLERRRSELDDALRAHGRPILLIVDDVDRLHPEELTQIFKLVRLVGRLPNVYYLLAFDETTVLDVMKSTGLANGDRARAQAYLEKMVQVRLDVPPIHPTFTGRLIDTYFDALTARHAVEVTSEAEYRFAKCYHEHMVRHLREPRQIKRYWAQVEALYPLLASEVDFIDFCLVVFVRTFHPGLIELVTEHKGELTGTSLNFGKEMGPKERGDVWRERLRPVVGEDTEGILSLLAELFVPIRGARDNMAYGSHAFQQLAEQRRVGSADYFDRYFHLAIGPDDLSDATVLEALSEVLDRAPGPAWEHVRALLPSNSEVALDKLRRAAPASSASAPALLVALASIADEVPESAGLFDRARVVLHFWAAELMRAADPDDGAALASEIAEAGGVAFLATTCGRALTQSDDSDQSEDDAIDSDLLTEAVRLIRAELDAQAAIPPASTKDALTLLSFWEMLDPDLDVSSWLQDTVNSGHWPAREVIGLFTPVGTVSTGAGPRRPALGDVQMELLDRWLGIDEILTKVGELPDPGGSVDWDRDLDVSFEGRVTKALRALARRKAEDQPPASTLDDD